MENILKNKNATASKIVDALNQTSDLHASSLKDLTTIEVTINPDKQICDFAEAYLSEVSNRNPLTLNQVDLRLDELISYFKFLIQARVMYCSDDRKPYPTYIQQFYVPC